MERKLIIGKCAVICLIIPPMNGRAFKRIIDITIAKRVPESVFTDGIKHTVTIIKGKK